MDGAIEIILDMAFAFVSVWIIRRYLNIFFVRKNRTISYMVFCVLLFGFQLFLELNKGEGVIWFTIINVILISIISVFGYMPAGIKKIFAIVIFYAVFMMVEILLFIILHFMDIDTERINILGSILSKLIIIIFINILYLNKTISKEKVYLPVTYILMLLFIPLGSIVIAHSSTSNIMNSPNEVLQTGVILLFINLFTFEIYNKLTQSFVIFRENEIYEYQMELLGKSTEEQENTMREFQIEKHNLKNKLSVLLKNIEENDKDSALENIESIVESFSFYSSQIAKSGNPIVDAIINFKHAIAKKRGIEFEVDLKIPSDIPVQQCDLGILLGNALDNGIEAVYNIKEGEKKIEIIMRIREQTMVTIIKNPYIHELSYDRNGNLLTGKEDKKNHGYGLSSILKVAEKYDGDMVIHAEDGIFTLTVFLNLPNYIEKDNNFSKEK